MLTDTAFRIREATPHDIDSIARLHTVSWQTTYANALCASYLKERAPQERQATWRERLENPAANQQVYVGCIGEHVQGFVCGYSGQNQRWTHYLDNLHVSPAAQGKGMGAALLKQMAIWFESQALQPSMCLLVNQDNRHAQDFYLKLGAKNAEPSIWHAPDGSDVNTFWFVWDTPAFQVLTHS